MENSTDAEKALIILRAFHDYVHKDRKLAIIITADWDINTLTVATTDGHWHFGQMNKEDENGFSILIDQMYKHFTTKFNEDGK